MPPVPSVISQLRSAFSKPSARATISRAPWWRMPASTTLGETARRPVSCSTGLNVSLRRSALSKGLPGSKRCAPSSEFERQQNAGGGLPAAATLPQVYQQQVALRSLGVLGESAMKLGPSIAVFSFAAQMLLACAPPAEPPPTRSAAVCNSDVIAAKVLDLNPPFSAESFGDCNAA